MKKQELIHTHSLLAQIQNHCETEADVDIQTEEYSSVGVKPTSIHKSKTAHKEGVLALANEVAEAFEQEMAEAEATA